MLLLNYFYKKMIIKPPIPSIHPVVPSKNAVSTNIKHSKYFH